MSAPASNDLTHDEFLGGRVRVWQPGKGFRAGTDTVMLAAAVTAEPGQSALELGCGAGTASLCLAHRVADLAVTGVEKQPDYAALARRNATENDLSVQVFTADITAMPAEIRTKSFDHVLANPPFFSAHAHKSPRDPGRREAHVDTEGGLAHWIDAGLRRLRPRGILTMIQRAERMQQILTHLAAHHCGDIAILPIAPRQNRPAGRVLIRVRKAARGPLTLLPPLVLHDGESNSPAAQKILRDAQAIRWT